jgi:para-aminobenzoate synthetase/4-amino-4-deoxychorismate lyase
MPNPQPDPEKAPDADSESASRLDPENASRPDPRQGVFETLLVAGGRPVELEAHMVRLATSLGELFGAELGADATDLVTGAAEGLGVGRVRLTATPRDGGIALEADGEAVDPASAFALAGRAVALRTLVVPGGLGSHKWADRTLLERAKAGMPDGTVALLVDDDGTVLEASRANAFAVRDGALITPPLDGRILPGIARAALIEVAREAGYEVREEHLTVADLTASDGVFLTGSVRGVQPASSLDGTKLPTADATALLAAAIRRRWLRPPG